jgi:hypothetical protein
MFAKSTGRMDTILSVVDLRIKDSIQKRLRWNFRIRSCFDKERTKKNKAILQINFKRKFFVAIFYLREMVPSVQIYGIL